MTMIKYPFKMKSKNINDANKRTLKILNGTDINVVKTLDIPIIALRYFTNDCSSLIAFLLPLTLCVLFNN